MPSGSRFATHLYEGSRQAAPSAASYNCRTREGAGWRGLPLTFQPYGNVWVGWIREEDRVSIRSLFDTNSCP